MWGGEFFYHHHEKCQGMRVLSYTRSRGRGTLCAVYCRPDVFSSTILSSRADTCLHEFGRGYAHQQHLLPYFPILGPFPRPDSLKLALGPSRTGTTSFRISCRLLT